MKDLTLKDYNNYMKVVNDKIKLTEELLKKHEYTKEVSKLSFQDWIKFQNGELKIVRKYEQQNETIWGEWQSVNIISPPSPCGTIPSTLKKMRVRYDSKNNSQFQEI